MNKNKFNLFPNPNSGRFIIDFEYINTNTQIEIYNLIGEKVLAKNIIQDKLSIDISDKPKGIYLIKIINEQNIQTQKVLIK